jgi:N-acyl-D-amino-acid deacylase
MGLVYAHEVNSSTEELLELAQNLKISGGYLSVHLRSEGGHIEESLDEVIELASKAQIPVKISHFKIRGPKNWHLGESLIQKLELAYHKGIDISFDVYPYSTSWSVLYTYLPKWAYEGGKDEILKTIATESKRKKILDFLRSQEYDYKKMVIATSEGNTGFIGKSISDIANNSGVTKEEALLNVLTACSTQAVAFDHNLSHDQIDEFLISPLSMVATDGAGYSQSSANLVHPRCYGAMPKFLEWVRTSKKLTWEEAIRKITSEPARILGIKNRGLVERNVMADLVVFDPQKVAPKATYENPYQISNGIDYVLVNGQVAFSDGKVQGRFGSALKKI